MGFCKYNNEQLGSSTGDTSLSDRWNSMAPQPVALEQHVAWDTTQCYVAPRDILTLSLANPK
jgi:hypothetical protein